MCPACNEPLVAFELEGVEIDRCLKCGGTWLDAGELDWVCARAGAGGGRPTTRDCPPSGDPAAGGGGPPQAESRVAGKLTEALAKGAGPRHGERRCVRCPGKLTVVKVDAVELDRCPRGHGLWFDRSELPKLIAGFTGGPEGALAHLLGELTASERKEAT